MELLGPNLTDLRYLQSKRRFSPGTTLRVAIQCIEGLKPLHNAGYIHRLINRLLINKLF